MANDGDYYFPLMRYFRYSMKCFSLRFTTSVVFKRINFGFGFVDYIAAISGKLTKFFYKIWLFQLNSNLISFKLVNSSLFIIYC